LEDDPRRRSAAGRKSGTVDRGLSGDRGYGMPNQPNTISADPAACAQKTRGNGRGRSSGDRAITPTVLDVYLKEGG
jgi:hypothetical protein